MWEAVAGEEALQPRDCRRLRWSDHDRAARAALDQVAPAKDQRRRDALAEIGLGDQERAQPLRGNQDDLDIALGVAVDQRDAARELGDLSEKLPRPLVDDRGDMPEAVALGDGDVAGQ